MRVPVTPEVLRWATERAARDGVDARARFPQLEAWEDGKTQPTLKQLEDFAKATHTPIGAYFLPAPPVEGLPIADFRVGPEFDGSKPSGNLLDTIYASQRRQDWYGGHARVERFDKVEWVGRYSLDDSPESAAAEFRSRLHLEVGERRDCADWQAFHRALVSRIENAGVLVATSGVVGSSTHRRLDPGEFRGFCLADPFAPLIFVNGADLKASQTFTVCHELAHLTLGHSGISAEDPAHFHQERVETWCDDFAAEMLVPKAEVRIDRGEPDDVKAALKLATKLKVTPLAALRRVVQLQERKSGEVAAQFARLRARLERPKQPGGDYYATALQHAGHRLARSVVASTLEGRTTYVEAFRLLNLKSVKTFDRLAEQLGYRQ